MSLSLVMPPASSLITDRLSLGATGLHSGEIVQMSLKLQDDEGVVWTSKMQFRADSDGVLGTAMMPSWAGTYVGTDVSGPFWSMQPPTGRSRQFQKEAKTRPHMLGMPALEPFCDITYQMSVERESGEIVTSSFTVQQLTREIEIIAVREGRIRGKLLRVKDRSRSKGAIVTLTGSGGGLETGYAQVLASQGYDVLSLAYFNYEDLWQTILEIPLEYFKEGFDYLLEQTGHSSVGVLGASKGGELSLILASEFPETVCSCTAIVPIHVSSEGWELSGAVNKPCWTLNGEDYPFVRLTGLPNVEQMRELGEKEENGYASAPHYMPPLSSTEAIQKGIAVEKARCSILLVSGEEDKMWPGRWGADRVVDRLMLHKFEYNFEHLVLPKTGHLTPLPNTPTYLSDAVFHSGLHIFMDCGGDPTCAARSSWMMWDAIVSQLDAAFSA